MPIIARLDKIILKMYFRQKEHNPPHIYALSGDCMGMFSLIDGEMFEGDLSTKDQKRVKEFVLHYREELLQMWKTQQFKALKPLK